MLLLMSSSKIDEGGSLRAGFDAQLDQLRSLSSSSKTWLADFEAKEQKRTGIKNLRIRFNGRQAISSKLRKANSIACPKAIPVGKP